MISWHDDVIARLRAPVAEDAYGNEVPDWAAAELAPVEVPGCRLIPEPGGEYTADRDATTTRWRLFAPVDADLRDTDRVRFYGDVYEIEGSVQRWRSPTGALAHLEALLRRTEG